MRKNVKRSDKNKLTNDEIAFVAPDGTAYTNKMVNEMEERIAAGDFGEGEWGPIHYAAGMPGGMYKRDWHRLRTQPPGRPPLADEPTDVVTFKMPHSLAEYVKRAAKACGQTKSKFIREAVLEKAAKVLGPE